MSDFLKAKFLRICPYGKQYLETLVNQCSLTMLLLAIFAVMAILIWNSMFSFFSPFYLTESILLALFLVGTEVPNYQLQEKEQQIYQELLLYCSRVKHQYMSCHHIANSILEASMGMSYEMERLAGEMYHLLMEGNRKEKIREYIQYRGTNRYLKLFLIQAYEVSEKGDLYFQENLEHIRLELMEEIYRRKRRTYAYSGYVFVTVAPFFLMPVLKSWGLEFAPELVSFYAGAGTVLETSVFAATLVIYDLIGRAKEITLFSAPGREKLIQTEWFYQSNIIAAMVNQLEQTEGKISNRIRRLLLQSGEYVSYGRLCVQMLLLAMASFLFLSVFFADLQTQEETMLLLAAEVCVCVAGGILAGSVPLLRLFLRARMIQEEAEHEVMQFQSILLMERRMQGVTIVGLLENMENFSQCYKGVLRRCINSYGTNPKKALLRLKEEGSQLHGSFESLADAFLSVDDVGIEAAFAEVESNRRLLERMNRLEAEIKQERRLDSIDLLSRIPVILAVGAYFILPFFAYSLQGVYEVFALLEEMQR